MASTEKLTPEQIRFLDNLFRAEYARMLRFAQSLTPSRQQAEEAIQETFLLVIVKYDKLRSSPNPRGWLYRALLYQALHINRIWQKDTRRLLALTEEMTALSYEMKEPVLSLEPSLQEKVDLLTRFYIDGLSIRELAQEAGCTTGAMKMRIARARQALKKFWEETNKP